MQRWLFRRELETLATTPVFYLDECGVDHRLYREYGRAPRGERIYQEVAGKRREHPSIALAVGAVTAGASVDVELGAVRRCIAVEQRLRDSVVTPKGRGVFVRRRCLKMGSDAGKVVVDQMLRRANDDIILAAEGRAGRVARRLQ